MAKAPIHRYVANSKAGRRIAAAASPILQASIPSKEVSDWNAQVEAKKLTKAIRTVKAPND